MSKKLAESIRIPNTLDQPNDKAKLTELPLLVNGFLSEDLELRAQITERLVAMALHDVEDGSSSNDLFLSPLISILKSANEEQSYIASESLSKIIVKSPQIRESLIKSGFIEIARFALIDNQTPDHVSSYMLRIIQDIVFNSDEVDEMGSLIPVLKKLSEEKDIKKKEIAKKAKKISAILASQGITGPNQSTDGQEKQSQNDQLKQENEELKRKDEEKTRKIADLEHQLEEAKPKTGEIPFQVINPTGSFTKKEGEFTYTATTSNCLTFPINPAINQGIFRCEFKANKVGNPWFGVLKTGLVIPTGNSTASSPYYKDSMIFYNQGQVYQNGKEISGNQFMKDNDTIVIEVNMAIPRTAHLFINSIQQPVFMSGLPESVQFYFFLYSSGDSATVLSLKKLAAPTIANIPQAKEVKWQ
ncbi:MAG: hypothetical protein EZS28_028483 [Streblomastix strix]|uniref:SPRY domain-containing protein n=1 Tax=Streblomastix strix TaxID=222440 RepID=A0A5J4UZV1_9EUKA|nr:MAG: hypothetical protein EZS28_028483 [Streblomastix strix]